MIVVSFCDIEIWGEGTMAIIPRNVNRKRHKNEKLVANMVERYNDTKERIRFKKELINNKEKAKKYLKAFYWYLKKYDLIQEEEHCYNFVKFWSKKYK